MLIIKKSLLIAAFALFLAAPVLAEESTESASSNTASLSIPHPQPLQQKSPQQACMNFLRAARKGKINLRQFIAQNYDVAIIFASSSLVLLPFSKSLSDSALRGLFSTALYTALRNHPIPQGTLQ